MQARKNARALVLLEAIESSSEEFFTEKLSERLKKIINGTLPPEPEEV